MSVANKPVEKSRPAEKRKRVSKAPEIRREELLQTAAQLFKEKGIAATGIGDITDRAEVARGTFYLYFASKDEVVGALWERYVNGHLQLMEERLSHTGVRAGDGLALMLELVTRLTEHSLEHAELHRLVYGTADAEAIAICRRANELIIVRLAEAMRTHLTAPNLSRDEPHLTASFILHGVHGALHDAIMQGGPVDRASFIDRVRRFAANALAGPS
ncbi:transcriptional regulator, TetR family [Rhizobiales bacterium GAS191]|nr:transcriptional regulator, TetR family [Rhizobiales bacterium GAS113]SEE12384.1 transcriptional regulator, TetR family [Rhizobiales bacterium GAS191]